MDFNLLYGTRRVLRGVRRRTYEGVTYEITVRGMPRGYFQGEARRLDDGALVVSGEKARSKQQARKAAEAKLDAAMTAEENH